MAFPNILPSSRSASAPRMDPALWPRTTHTDDAGRLTVGGVALAGIADKVGTPACVLDEADFRYRAQRYRKQLPGTKVVYAGGALLTRAVATWAGQENLGVGVRSPDELATALAGGVHPARIVYHGTTRTRDGLAAAVTAGVGRIVVGSMTDVTQLTGLAQTQQHVRVDDLELVSAVAREPMLRLVGLHCHIGSQVTAAESYAAAVQRMIRSMADVRRTHRLVLGELNIGGGHGVPYLRGDAELDLRALSQVVDDALDTACAAERFPRPTIVVEPGRALAARAGVALYRVLSVAEHRGERTVVTVDGDPATGSRYTATLANRPPLGPARPMTVVGHPRVRGVVMQDIELPNDVGPGDLMAVACTGAYHATAPLFAVCDGKLCTLTD